MTNKVAGVQKQHAVKGKTECEWHMKKERGGGVLQDDYLVVLNSALVSMVKRVKPYVQLYSLSRAM